MKVKKIINIFGGPGCGKSMITAGLFYKMKELHFNVEMVTEYAKQLVHENRFDILNGDQFYISSKQHRRIEIASNIYEYVIVDSPLLLTHIYFNKKFNKTDIILLDKLVLDLYNKYPNENYFLLRNPEFSYKDEEGRYQNNKEAEQIDNKILQYLEINKIPFKKILSDKNTINTILKDFI